MDTVPKYGLDAIVSICGLESYACAIGSEREHLNLITAVSRGDVL